MVAEFGRRHDIGVGVGDQGFEVAGRDIREGQAAGVSRTA
jgi:hypothetical protein